MSDEGPQEAIREVANIWTQYANIKFIWNSTPPVDADIRITQDKEDGSWSFIGNSAHLVDPEKATMNFGWLNDSDTAQTTQLKRTVLHEFGHALGLGHEHQHPLINIPWNHEAVYRYYRQFGWTPEQVDHNFFISLALEEVAMDNYDRESIMHYHIPQEFTIGDFTVPWNDDLSDHDKKFITRLYPRVAGEHDVYLPAIRS